MKSNRWLAALVGAVSLLGSGYAQAVDGVIEISETGIAAGGGYPLTLVDPGAYVLTSNLFAPAGTPAIITAAPNIDIDLNGFEIASGGAGGAIAIDGSSDSGLTVRNGSIVGFGGPAIFLGPESTVRHMKIRGNGAGIVGGFNCLIVMNVITGNSLGTGDGVLGDQCKIENNVIDGNIGVGISGSGNVIINNRVSGHPTGGILDAAGSTIQANVVIGNGGFGISDDMPGPPPVPSPVGSPRTDARANVVDNTFIGPGISFIAPALITDNTVTNSALDGILCGSACSVRGNVVDRNNLTVTAGSGGVTVAPFSNVHANTISNNEGFGLTIDPVSGYQNNTISNNGTPLGAGPDVIYLGIPPSITGGAGNNCTGAPCP